MIAAIYARKSTKETGADDDAKSVQRQIENARVFAVAKGWTVAAAHIYSDGATSGPKRPSSSTGGGCSPPSTVAARRSRS